MKTYIGIELGSTRIKAVALNERYEVISTGSYTWKSEYRNGIWTYALEEAWCGLRAALSEVMTKVKKETVASVGISGMMHGYLAFDENWNLLAPFRTWQNTITEEAAAILTERFGFHIPQRWSVAHLYQAILHGEEHLPALCHITTLAGYIHAMLTGENVLGIGEASGMFPIDPQTKTYDKTMLSAFHTLAAQHGFAKPLEALLPHVLTAGENAGALSEEGARRLDGVLPAGVRFAPPEGDMQTGMVATNSVAVGTGNISAGTSINLAVISGKSLSRLYSEVDIIMTPSGETSILLHANNCTNDLNAWVNVLGETAKLFGAAPTTGELYEKLFTLSLDGAPDCGGVVVYNYMAGESLSGVFDGRPIVVRRPDADFTLANLMRAQLYGSLATLKLGTEILEKEGITLSRITGHGGYFKTPVVGQRYMAAACKTPIVCNESAGEGGPFGMALLAMYPGGQERLEDFLARVFCEVKSTELAPVAQDIAGFDAYMQNFKNGLEMEKIAQKL